MEQSNETHPANFDVRAIEIVNMCSICCGSLETPITLPCVHTFCYLCIKGVIFTSRNNGTDSLCPLCRYPIDRSLFENASADIDTLHQPKEQYAWMYKGRKGGWWYYQPSHNIKIEEAYQKYIDLGEEDTGEDVVIEVWSKNYIIDFETMQQYPQLSPHETRDIKRVDKFDLDEISTKGVAGVRYSKK